MRLGIDASNIRGGGGLTHLSSLLNVAEPDKAGISQIIVWGNQDTLSQLSPHPWLSLRHEPLLDGTLPKRLLWQRYRLGKLALQNCDLLFIPGGIYNRRFRPYVTMSQNMLPFTRDERRRYGLSLTHLRLALLKFSLSCSFRHADGIIFLTRYASQTIMRQVKHFAGDRMIIPHGIDRRFYRHPCLQRTLDTYSFSAPFRLLYVSIIDLYKHQWHLVDAMGKLRQRQIPVALDLVGPAYGPALKRLKRMIQRVDNASAFIRYHGSVPYARLPALYHQADAFVFASSCENMPNILMEAMASGLPIMCSHYDPMPEILGDAGIYFDPTDPQDIARATDRLVTNVELRTQCAHNAYEKAQQYSWERCAHDTLAFMAHVFQKSSARYHSNRV